MVENCVEVLRVILKRERMRKSIGPGVAVYDMLRIRITLGNLIDDLMDACPAVDGIMVNSSIAELMNRRADHEIDKCY